MKRCLLWLLLTLYVAVALLNYSFTQSLLGAAAGSYLSEQTGGTVKIGSLHASPFSHLILRDVLLVTPGNDTVFDGRRVSCYFKKFPYSANKLELRRVRIEDAYYHLHTEKGYINLSYLIDYFSSGTPSAGGSEPFTVEVGELLMSNIHYKQDLKDYPRTFEHGVHYPHMEFFNVGGKIKNIRIVNDHVICRFVKFHAEEKSGFRLRDLSMDVEVSSHGIRALDMELITDSTRLLCDATLDYCSWNTMNDYCDSVPMDLVLKPGTKVAMSDVAYWAPVLWGMNTVATVEGHAYGPVCNLHAENFTLSFGDRTLAFFDGSVSGLPVAKKMDFNVDLHSLSTCTADINEMLTAFHVPQTRAMERLIRQVGNIDLSATLEGTPNDCFATLGAACEMGNLEGDVLIAYDSVLKDYRYSGKVASQGLDIASVVPNEWVTHSGFSCVLDGVGVEPSTLSATLSATLFNSMVRGVPLRNTVIHADVDSQVLTAEVHLDDTLLRLDVAGSVDWHDSVTAYVADVDVRSANLSGLHLWQSQDEDNPDQVSLSLQLHADLSGDSLDGLSGQVLFEDCDFQKNGQHLRLNNAALTSLPRYGRKDITLLCDWLTLRLHGYFDYADVPMAVRHFEQNYVSGYAFHHEEAEGADWSEIADMSLNIDLSVADAHSPLQMFLPSIGVADGTSLNGSYNYAESLKLVVRSDSLSAGGVTMYDIGLNGGLNGANYAMDVDVEGLRLGAISLLEQLRCSVMLRPELSLLRIRWGSAGNQDARISEWGDLGFAMKSDSTGNFLSLLHPTFAFGEDIWDITVDKPIFLAKDTFQVASLQFASEDQSMSVSAYGGLHIEDSLSVDFSQFSIARLSELFMRGSGMEFSGTLDGSCHVVESDANPYMNAALAVEDCEINGQPLGQVQLLSDWNAEQNRLNVSLHSLLPKGDGWMRPITAVGHVGMDDKDSEFQFDVALEDIHLHALAPLVSGFSSRVEGRLDAALTAHGTLKNPVVEGYVAVTDGLLTVDATGVAYRVSDTIAVADGRVLIDTMAVYDPQGNRAMVSGTISYQAPLSLDVQLRTDNLMVVDKKASGSSFFGTLYAAVDGRVRGPLDELYVTGNVRTNPGSEITVPISDKKTVRSQGFITFVGDEYLEEAVSEDDPVQTASNSALRIDVAASITPDVKVNLPMDFSQMYVKMGATGLGDLRLTMSEGEAPMVQGDYEIVNGTMNLTLLSLLTRNFTIDEGSSIDFNGSLSDIRFDVKAVYSQRVSLSTLTGMASSESMPNNVVVEDVISLSGNLESPTLGFDIRLPNADQSVEELVFAYIDRTNDRDMLNQSVSLLLMGKFYNSSTASEITDVGNYASNGYAMVASTVGSLVSSMVDFVDLNFDYKAATALSSEQLGVDISKEWNKFYFESTFGYDMESSELGMGNTYNLVGDMLVGYKISPLVHLFVFNRSNTNDYTRVDLPYKQGVGLKLTKDFDTWKNLWKKQK